MKRRQNDFESHTQRLTRLLDDAIIGLVGILFLMVAIASMLLWSAGHPEISAFLPEWLHPNPASVVTLPALEPEGVER